MNAELATHLRAITAALAAAITCFLAAAAPPFALAHARGDVRVVGNVPAPGYPALPHVLGGVIYEGTYDNPYGSSLPSRVY